jgi:hypothetical protein
MSCHVILVGCKDTFTPQVSSSCTGHHLLANSTLLLWPPPEGPWSKDLAACRAQQEAKAGEPQYDDQGCRTWEDNQPGDYG